MYTNKHNNIQQRYCKSIQFPCTRVWWTLTVLLSLTILLATKKGAIPFYLHCCVSQTTQAKNFNSKTNNTKKILGL